MTVLTALCVSLAPRLYIMVLCVRVCVCVVLLVGVVFVVVVHRVPNILNFLCRLMKATPLHA